MLRGVSPGRRGPESYRYLLFDWDTFWEINRRHYSRKHYEGYEQLWRLATRAVSAWMQGHLEEAASYVENAEEIGINPRWYHDYLPLKADIAADCGQLDLVRETAERYLATDVYDSEQSKKIGVLNPLVRAEVDAALAAEGEQRESHAAAARKAVQRAERLMEEFPPKFNGSNQMETAKTHLAFVRAEASRLEASDADLWRNVSERCDWIYFQLYAHWRFAEALLASGQADEGRAALIETHSEVRRVSLNRVQGLIEETARQYSITLP